MFSTRILVFITFLSLQITQLILAQDFKSTFVQDDFLPIPLAAPLADSVDGELKQDPRCLEQNEIGNGTGEIIRYFYNSANSSCSSFLYSGEGGNQNNFLTEIDCLNNCYIDVNEGAPLKEEDVHMINQEADLGPKQGCLLAKDGGGEGAGGKKNCTELETSVLENQHFMA